MIDTLTGNCIAAINPLASSNCPTNVDFEDIGASENSASIVKIEEGYEIAITREVPYTNFKQFDLYYTSTENDSNAYITYIQSDHDSPNCTSEGVNNNEICVSASSILECNLYEQKVSYRENMTVRLFFQLL